VINPDPHKTQPSKNNLEVIHEVARESSTVTANPYSQMLASQSTDHIPGSMLASHETGQEEEKYLLRSAPDKGESHSRFQESDEKKKSKKLL